jgi:hypothetical protein
VYCEELAMAGIDRRAAVGALAPLVVTLAAVIATYATATTTGTIEAAVDSPRLIFGYFSERFPILAFAIVFVLARLVVLAIRARRPRLLIRLPLLVLALAFVLFSALYPTFGGVIARPGFLAGGLSLVDARVVGGDVALLLGGAVSGVMLAFVTGFARALIDWSWGLTWGRLMRAVLALIAYAVMGTLLAWGWSTLEAARSAFPRGPLSLVDTIALTGLIIVATAPQIVVAALGDCARRGAGQ